ncbi:hypothetical protein [Pedobacter sp. R-06]|uniref:hypothetical protein n=1 Tax=Pedobacter sp. R-06 TaxID=3404051 RepID=UPI003CF3A586
MTIFQDHSPSLSIRATNEKENALVSEVAATTGFRNEGLRRLSTQPKIVALTRPPRPD